jgi:hypothetical protein
MTVTMYITPCNILMFVGPCPKIIIIILELNVHHSRADTRHFGLHTHNCGNNVKLVQPEARHSALREELSLERPGRSILELILFIFAIRTLFKLQSRTRVDKNFIQFSDRVRFHGPFGNFLANAGPGRKSTSLWMNGRLNPSLIQFKHKYRLILDESISFGTVSRTSCGLTKLYNVPVSFLCFTSFSVSS